MAAPHSPHPDALTQRKALLRQQALAARASQDGATSGAAIAALIRAHLAFPAASVVAGVWPLPGEIDLTPLWHALHEAGHTITLPETPARGHPLTFRAWRPGCTMRRERFGTLCPDGDPAEPSHLFVPLLAFDATGHRLGYGGGFYDRTLAARPGLPAYGFGYAACQMDSLPVGPFDRALDAIFTERGLAVDRRAGS